MTMFSAENRQFYYGEGFCMMSQIDGEDDLALGPSMAEEGSKNDEKTESSSKDVDQEDDKDEGWLQLSIGGHNSQHHKKDEQKHVSGLIELDLLPNSSGNNNNSCNNNLHMRPLGLMPEYRAPPRQVMNFASPSFFLPGNSNTSNFHQQHQEINWGFRPIPIPISIAAASSSSFSTPSSSYFSRPFQLYSGIDLPGPGIDFRVIQPPKRPHSGIWFMLQASQNQEKEPFLPQISKSYLRIKDGRMTIRLVTKYLVNKLRLENESEIEIRCKGQKLVPFLTLQHVRDNIWSSPRDFITLLPNSSTTDHIMVLHYARTISS